ncbi:stealth conserved region 3 domain-containing protein [Microlunatus sp. GCM10028923]|uniref:stealth conserved region 3 domain-containing protein n=1 Tax=Microlunatus sp. GCM10028923 TaxID=3273400 RepID=UPI00360F8B81
MTKRLTARVRRTSSRLLGRLAARGAAHRTPAPADDLDRFVAANPVARHPAAGVRVVPVRGGWQLVQDVPDLDTGDAYRRNRDQLVELCERNGIDYFALIDPSEASGRIAVADPDWARFADAVAEAGTRIPFYVETWAADGRRTPALPTADPDARAALLAAHRVLVFVQYALPGSAIRLGRPYGCLIERWSVDRDGVLRAPVANRVTQAVGPAGRSPAVVQDRGRAVTTLAPFTEPNALTIDFPIDVVVPWIDDTDPTWLARRARHLADAAEAETDAVPVPRDALAPTPIGDPSLLRFTLRSVAHHLPWVRTIHLVADGQYPAWLDPSATRVRVTDVADLLESRGTLPTFNPEAVRSSLHHLDGLAGRYLVIEPGTVINRPLPADLFFHANGLLKLGFDRATLPLVDAAAAPIDVAVRRNVADLLEQAFGRRPSQAFAPGPIPQNRDLLLELQARFPELFKHNWGSQIRTAAGYEITSWLHHYYAHFTGRAAPGRVRAEFVETTQGNVRTRLRNVLRDRGVEVTTLGNGAYGDPAAAAAVRTSLSRWLPAPARHELYAEQPVTPRRTWN